jgi:hypothetical protein
MVKTLNNNKSKEKVLFLNAGLCDGLSHDLPENTKGYNLKYILYIKLSHLVTSQLQKCM